MKGLIVALLFTSHMFADSIYWYNGQNDEVGSFLNEVGGFSNEIGGTGNSSLAYDDFDVGAGGVNITGVFSNDLVVNFITGDASGIVTQADWEIRTGVGPGSGGTIVASGTSAASQTDTMTDYFGAEIYTVAVNGLNVSLAPGAYWLAVAPVLPASTDYTDYESRIVTTAGFMSVGTPGAKDYESYVNGVYDDREFNFAQTFTLLGYYDPNDGAIDLSMGVLTSSSLEPGSLSLIVSGGLGGLWLWKRRRSSLLKRVNAA